MLILSFREDLSSSGRTYPSTSQQCSGCNQMSLIGSLQSMSVTDDDAVKVKRAILSPPSTT